MKKIALLVLIAMIGCLFGITPQAEALSCAPPQPVQQEMDRSSIVFKGKVIDIKKGGLTVFQVEEAWKGVAGPVIEIYDSGWDPYTKHTEYLVFGGQREGELRTNLCGRTGLWNQEREEAMKAANVQSTVFPKDAPPVVKERGEQSRQGALLVAALLLIFIVISLFAVWRWYIRRTGK